ncbi:hypothetical protein Q5752_001753 [Cryptotrichosporon argae]
MVQSIPYKAVELAFATDDVPTGNHLISHAELASGTYRLIEYDALLAPDGDARDRPESPWFDAQDKARRQRISRLAYSELYGDSALGPVRAETAAPSETTATASQPEPEQPPDLTSSTTTTTSSNSSGRDDKLETPAPNAIGEAVVTRTRQADEEKKVIAQTFASHKRRQGDLSQPVSREGSATTVGFQHKLSYAAMAAKSMQSSARPVRFKPAWETSPRNATPVPPPAIPSPISNDQTRDRSVTPTPKATRSTIKSKAAQMLQSPTGHGSRDTASILQLPGSRCDSTGPASTRSPPPEKPRDSRNPIITITSLSCRGALWDVYRGTMRQPVVRDNTDDDPSLTVPPVDRPVVAKVTIVKDFEDLTRSWPLAFFPDEHGACEGETDRTPGGVYDNDHELDLEARLELANVEEYTWYTAPSDHVGTNIGPDDPLYSKDDPDMFTTAYSRQDAYLAVRKEAKRYMSEFEKVQGRLVPRFHGLYRAYVRRRVPGPTSAPEPATSEWDAIEPLRNIVPVRYAEVYVMILEDVGEPVVKTYMPRELDVPKQFWEPLWQLHRRFIRETGYVHTLQDLRAVLHRPEHTGSALVFVDMKNINEVRLYRDALYFVESGLAQLFKAPPAEWFDKLGPGLSGSAWGYKAKLDTSGNVYVTFEMPDNDSAYQACRERELRRLRRYK